MSDEITLDLNDLRNDYGAPVDEDVPMADEDTAEEYSFTKKKINPDKDVLIKKIAKYYNEFPELRQKIKKPSNLNKKTVEQLEQFLKDLDNSLSNDSGTDMVKIAYQSCIQCIELTGKSYGYNLCGLTESTANNAFIDKQLKRIAIKYCSDLDEYAEPEVMLLMGTVGATYATYNLNLKKEKIDKHMNQDVESDIENELENL